MAAQRSQSSYAKILDAASRVFDQKGYHGATVQDIADAAQLTKGGIYHYLKSKEEALFAINERILQDGLTKVLAISEAEQPVEERLRGVIVVVTAQHDVFTPDLRVALNEFGSLSAGYRKKIVSLRDRMENVIRALLVEGIEAGIVVDEPPGLLAKYIFGAINWMSAWYRPTGEFSAREIGDKFADHLLLGLLVSSGPSDSKVKSSRPRTLPRTG